MPFGRERFSKAQLQEAHIGVSRRQFVNHQRPLRPAVVSRPRCDSLGLMFF
jgi:hypothetical protein